MKLGQKLWENGLNYYIGAKEYEKQPWKRPGAVSGSSKLTQETVGDMTGLGSHCLRS